MLRSTSSLRLIAATALLFASSLAQAQYSWIGENGVRQFSDRPPPPNTPPHKILKAPGRAPAPTPVAAPAPAPAAPTVKPAPTLADRDAEYRERLKKTEEAERKAQADAQRQRDAAERCEAARESRAQVESGVRIGRIGAQGERRIATDEERAAQLARANKVLAECR
ncbi:DUF4124 domain-containing protein [Massilia sp. 9I]|uniref:DUF4124 domain-containing protein n=1 Tax=Massilia sp. 9I TaxID=2653152 RepID=UPI0012F066DD|nr:DUF4124 domain-containing protein [Massilia sp. 9I]VXB83482.1 conserved exported hypothetical protein [Massilia sp. 9I]